MSETKHPLKVFLCHASIDKSKVRELYRYLKRRGIQPWFDEEDLVAGQDWRIEIPKALATSDAIIICLTKNSVDKEGYVQTEIKFALDKVLEMPEGRIFLVPVRFEECEVPLSLSRFQYVDLFAETGYSKMMKGLKFRASQLQRSIIELPKTTVEEAKLVREQEEREAAEKLVLEKTKHDADEKSRREKAEQDIAEKEALRKMARESAEKVDRETATKNELSKKSAEDKGSVVQRIDKSREALGQLENDSKINLTSQLEQIKTIKKYRIRPVIIIIIFALITASVFIGLLLSGTFSWTLPVRLLHPDLSDFIDSKGIPMRLIPSGKFIMGGEIADSMTECQKYLSNCQSSWFETEVPPHDVNLAAFYIDKYEVTNQMYKECVVAGTCQEPNHKFSLKHPQYYGNPQFRNYPVIWVDWYMAKSYCGWRGARLPSEAEWEKSGRGSDGNIYPWGNYLNCSYANFGGCNQDTTIVGNYKAGKSVYGVYDLTGNVWEWVSSLKFSYPYNPNDGREDLLASGLRSLRGGSYHYEDINVQTKFRASINPSGAGQVIGFRCARDANP